MGAEYSIEPPGQVWLLEPRVDREENERVQFVSFFFSSSSSLSFLWSFGGCACGAQYQILDWNDHCRSDVIGVMIPFPHSIVCDAMSLDMI